MQEKRDIFDRMMALPILNIFEPFYKKNKEVLLYLFFGGLTFIVSIATYAVFNVSMGINELIANVMSWVLAVLFAFATNRVWVFQAPTHTITITCAITFTTMLLKPSQVINTSRMISSITSVTTRPPKNESICFKNSVIVCVGA